MTIESFGGVSTGGSRSGSRGRSRGRMREISKPGDGPTTGLIVSTDGYIVTSTFNFLRRPPVITVIRQDGSRHVAKLLGRDETRKICLLKIDGVNDLPVPAFVPPAEVKVGWWAISVGVGYGDTEPAISAGIVSAKNRISGRAIQTDANTSPANYGGPLVDINGRVIGVCVPLHPRSKEAASGVDWYDSGIGFAIPLSGAEKLLAALKAGKTLRPADLGVEVKAADDQGRGAVIVEVREDSAASKADLKSGDRILSIGGETIQDVAHLGTVIGRYHAGEQVKLLIQREDKQREVDVTLGIATQPQKPAAKPKKPAH